jgi:hypothetical protein
MSNPAEHTEKMLKNVNSLITELHEVEKDGHLDSDAKMSIAIGGIHHYNLVELRTLLQEIQGNS